MCAREKAPVSRQRLGLSLFGLVFAHFDEGKRAVFFLLWTYSFGFGSVLILKGGHGTGDFLSLLCGLFLVVFAWWARVFFVDT